MTAVYLNTETSLELETLDSREREELVHSNIHVGIEYMYVQALSTGKGEPDGEGGDVWIDQTGVVDNRRASWCFQCQFLLGTHMSWVRATSTRMMAKNLKVMFHSRVSEVVKHKE